MRDEQDAPHQELEGLKITEGRGKVSQTVQLKTQQKEQEPVFLWFEVEKAKEGRRRSAHPIKTPTPQ